MEKPYVVCHMLTSLDGKIDGSWFSDPACSPALKAYGSLRNTFDCNATIYGTTTALGSYSDGLAGELPRSETVYHREDYAAEPDFGNYIVCLDADGILGWNRGWSEKKGRAKAHVIEVLTDSVSNDYLAYLQSRGVSYVFAGVNEIDCALLLRKLQSLFQIHRIILAGGGITNWNFAKAGLIDELSIVIAPVADGSTKAVSIFEEMPGRKASISMKLKTVKPLDGNVLWLTYTK